MGQETITTRGVEDPRLLTFMGKGWDWRGKDCEWAEDGKIGMASLYEGRRELVTVGGIASLYKGRRELVTVH